MKNYIFFLFFSLFSLTTITAQETIDTASIEVTITNLANLHGIIGINLFEDKDGFPSDYKKALATKTFDLGKDELEFILESIPPGDYALSVLHDENSNFKLDTNLFGIPKEGYAVSNNAKPGKFGPPKFKDAKFSHGISTSKLVLTIRY